MTRLLSRLGGRPRLHLRHAGTDPALGKANPPAGGSLQEWDIPEWEPRLDQAGDAFAAGDYTAQPPGTWAWPPRV